MKRKSIERLHAVFHDFPATLNESVLGNASTVEVPAGARLFDDREPCQGLPLLVEGRVRVVKSAEHGRELLLYHLWPGDSCIISTCCLLGARPYNARGIAEMDSSLVILPRSAFDKLILDPMFRQFVFSAFSNRLGDLMQLIEEVAFQRLDRRLASLLLGKGPLIHTTHQQLADELGSVREIISRLLNRLSNQGLIRIKREQIEILDPAGLRRVGK